MLGIMCIIIIRPLTPEEQKEWEKKLTQYAYIVSVTSNTLIEVNKAANEKLTGIPLGVTVSLTNALLVGLEKVYDILSGAYDEVKDGKWPDFTSEVPFPPAPSPPPSNIDGSPSWFETSWRTVQDDLDYLALHNGKIALLLPPIVAAGDELVRELQKYFPPDNGYKYPSLKSFPSFPTAKPHPAKCDGQTTQVQIGHPVEFSINIQ